MYKSSRPGAEMSFRAASILVQRFHTIYNAPVFIRAFGQYTVK